MSPLHSVALVFLLASPSLGIHPRHVRSQGFQHHSYDSNFASSKSFSSGALVDPNTQTYQASASAPIVQTKLSFNGCSSDKGCGGVAIENGQVTHQFGNPEAVGIDLANPGNLDPAELHKKFALQAADINSAFAGNLPAHGPFWWTAENSPFKNAQETYEQFVKASGLNAAPFSSPCGTPACPFGSGSSFSSSGSKTSANGGVIANDISSGPFAGGLFAQNGFTNDAAASIDISKNPFLNGKINLPAFSSGGNSFQSSFESSSHGGSNNAASAINIAGNPFLNGAISGSAASAVGCTGGKTGACSQIPGSVSQQVGTTSFQQGGLSGNAASSQSSSTTGFGNVNLGSNPFFNGQNTAGQSTGSVTTSGCNGLAGCNSQSQVLTTTGFGQQNQVVSTGFGQQSQVTTGSGCSGAFCGQDQQTQQGFPKPQNTGTTGFGQQNQITSTGCSGAFCGQEQKNQVITTGFGQQSQQTTGSGCSGAFCGQDQQNQQGFPKPGYDSSLPHPPGSTAGGFRETQNTVGELTVSCSGQGNICVDKSLCINGFVNDNGENILQARGGTKCRLASEVCCRFKPQTPQTSFTSSGGNKFDTSFQTTGPSSTGQGLIQVQGSTNQQDTAFKQTGNQQQTAYNQQNSFNQQGYNNGYKDSSSAQSQNYPRPGANIQKPGIPYLPPDNAQSTSEIITPKPVAPPTPYRPVKTPPPYVPPTPKPTPYVPQTPKPTPYVPQTPKPTPYVPQTPKPTPYVPQTPKPTPYVPQTPRPTQYVPQTPKPTPYVPPTPKPTPYKPPTTQGPAYLPPEDERPQPSMGNQKVIPPPDVEGSLILDETREPPRKDIVIPSVIPSGCAAALKCTRIEFCTADGVISNSTVRLTKEQQDFRVPLTDCKEPDSGVIGKCCRDPTYTDPWPTNQLGQWVPGAFGDTGAYVADNYRNPDKNPGRGPNRNPGPVRGPNPGFSRGPGSDAGESINTPIYTKPSNPSPVNYNKPQVPNQPNNFPAVPVYNKVDPIANPGRFPNPGAVAGVPPKKNEAPETYVTGSLTLDTFINGQGKGNKAPDTCGVRQPGQKPLGKKDSFEADFAEVPWQAMVLLQTNRSLLCGGIITAADTVVTSAHCVDGLDAKSVLVKGGEWKLGVDDEPSPFQIIPVQRITVHPEYFSGSLQNDMAVLHLGEKFRAQNNIAPICVDPQPVSEQELYGGDYKCITTGWGKQVLQVNIPNSIMHAIDMNLITPAQCQAQIQQNYPHLLEQYNPNTCICGLPVRASVCRVDVGSALACSNGKGSYTLQGVYSWDSGCQSQSQLAAFYKFDSFWYQSVVTPGSVQTSSIQQQGYSNNQQQFNQQFNQQQVASNQQVQQIAYQPKPPQAYQQTFVSQGQSPNPQGHQVFQQGVKGHVHTGANCQCYENGKK